MANDGYEIVVEDPPSMHLLGLMMRGLLADNLAVPWKRHRARRLRGEVVVVAGGMQVALRFSEDVLVVSREPGSRPRARVSGAMTALLGMVTGSGLVLPVLMGRVRIRGDILFLFRLLPLLRAQDGDRP